MGRDELARPGARHPDPFLSTYFRSWEKDRAENVKKANGESAMCYVRNDLKSRPLCQNLMPEIAIFGIQPILKFEV